MQVTKAQHIYFIGIGGIGMSALAVYFKSIGKAVAGYDKTQSTITQNLEDKGIHCHFTDDISLIPQEYLDKDQTLVVYTPAVPSTHQELSFFKAQGFEILKRAVVLGKVTEGTYCLAVAGTHGKTTTTSILGHLLYQCNVEVTAFLGGISENYNSNYISRGGDVTVVEADEFDRSFLNLSPNMACITSMDADHLDIYGNAKTLEESFEAFGQLAQRNGTLFVRQGLPLKGTTYGIEDQSDYSAQHVKITNGSYVFDLKTPKTIIKDIQFNLPGRHNLSNAVIALAMAVEYGCPHLQLAEALASYKGVKRRFTIHIKTEDLVLIDDYAHHPEEIKALHHAIREMYPSKKVLAVFQPHLFSRTRDFIEGFAKSLSEFDELIVLDIYPAREEPIAGVTSQWLLDKITISHKSLSTKKDLVSRIKNSAAQVVVTIGAGDIGEEVKHIKQALSVAS